MFILKNIFLTVLQQQGTDLYLNDRNLRCEAVRSTSLSLVTTVCTFVEGNIIRFVKFTHYAHVRVLDAGVSTYVQSFMYKYKFYLYTYLLPVLCNI